MCIKIQIVLLLFFANGFHSKEENLDKIEKIGQIHQKFEESLFNEKDQVVKKIRPKRSLLSLYSMINCAIDCDPLTYVGYGCFCGLYGSGIPVDGIDRCCQEHDWCYTNLKCPLWQYYSVSYYWQCINNKGHCDNDNGLWDYFLPCAVKLCQCDKIFSECLQEYHRQYPCPVRKATCGYSYWNN